MFKPLVTSLALVLLATNAFASESDVKENRDLVPYHVQTVSPEDKEIKNRKNEFFLKLIENFKQKNSSDADFVESSLLNPTSSTKGLLSRILGRESLAILKNYVKTSSDLPILKAPFERKMTEDPITQELVKQLVSISPPLQSLYSVYIYEQATEKVRLAREMIPQKIWQNIQSDILYSSNGPTYASYKDLLSLGITNKKHLGIMEDFRKNNLRFIEGEDPKMRNIKSKRWYKIFPKKREDPRTISYGGVIDTTNFYAGYHNK